MVGGWECRGGGSLTGFGGHTIVIDDFMKAADAASEITRQEVKSLYGGTLMSRFEQQSSGKIIVVQQRLHEDDFANFLMEKGIYHHLNLPAIAPEEATIPLMGGRQKVRRVGELLSGMYTRAELEALRVEMGAANFEAQYQQNPHPSGGVGYSLGDNQDVLPGA